MKIALLNAHTAYSPGAVQDLAGTPTSEYFWSSRINNILLQIISKNHPDSNSAIIDTSNIKPYTKSLRYKAFLVNRDGYDIVIETHLNSAVTALATGMEVLYGSEKPESRTLAFSLAQGLEQYLPFKLRHHEGVVSRKNLYILKATSCPSAIVEVLFLSNKLDKVYLAYPRSASIIANALYTGIQTYLSSKGDS